MNAMPDLPAPLTDPSCDLRDFAFMPLDVARLRDSHLAALETPAACWAAVLLWCASWHQVPAASLPDDDRLLARITGYLRAEREWNRVRAGALRGWIKCSDGRLYHPVVAEKANDSWRAKLERMWRTECARIDKHNQRSEQKRLKLTLEDWLCARAAAGVRNDIPKLSDRTEPICPQDNAPLSGQTDRQSPQDKPSASGRTDSECPPPVLVESASKGQGQGQGQGEKEEDPSLRSGAAAASPGVRTARDDLWQFGLPLLRQLTGQGDRPARSLLGKLLREVGDDCARALVLIRQAVDERPIEPAAWLSAAAKARGSGGRLAHLASGWETPAPPREFDLELSAEVAQ